MDEPRAWYQLNVSRIFFAQPPVLYRAFTDPSLLVDWFPPVGSRMPPDQVTIDARPGGDFRYTLVDAGDPARPITTSAVFHDVAADRLLTWTAEGAAGTAADETDDLLELIGEPAGHTRLELREGPLTYDEEIAARARWNIAFGRLDTTLEQMEHLAGA